MFWLAVAGSAAIGLAYAAIFLTVLRTVLLRDGQWRTNPLATATAAIFFSCGVGHALHGLHLLHEGPTTQGLYDEPMVWWDAATACVAVWYWSLRGQVRGLSRPASLFQDAREAEQRRTSQVLHGLFDGVVVLDLQGALDAPARATSRGDDPLLADLLARAELAPVVELLGPDGARDALLPLVERLLRGAHGTSTVESTTTTGTCEVHLVTYDEARAVVAWRDTSGVTSLRHDKQVAEARLAAAFDASPVAMALVDGGAVQVANPALARLLGRAVPARRWDQLFDPADRVDAQSRLDAALQGEVSPPWDARLLTEHEDPRWVSAYLSPVQTTPGEPPYAVAHLVDIEERKRYESRLRHVAEHDPLTGLANRRRFESELSRHCDATRRYGPTGAVLLLDLDHFKEVNDTLGHGVGDELLVSVARLLEGETRESDLVARLGGDEFAVLLPHADREEGAAVAERVCAAIRDHTRRFSGVEVGKRVTASAGLALIGDVEPTPEALMMAADLTLYDAKEAGRDTWTSYADGQHSQPRTKSRLQWLERLRVALDGEGLVVLAQPLLDLRTGRRDSAELLLRLQGPDGLVPPARFLYMAEQSDLICDVDRWMVRHVLDLLQRRPDVSLAVNVSGRSLSDSAVSDELVRLVAAAGLQPGRLTVEVTETAAVANLHEAREVLQQLQGVGCRIALDDFGAGFGSLAYVKHLPFDVLKIDGQFVEQCARDAVDLTVVDACVSLARGLGKTVVAEHVTDAETLDLLRRHDVDLAQGYHVGHPVPLEQLVPSPRGALDDVIVLREGVPQHG